MFTALLFRFGRVYLPPGERHSSLPEQLRTQGKEKNRKNTNKHRYIVAKCHDSTTRSQSILGWLRLLLGSYFTSV